MKVAPAQIDNFIKNDLSNLKAALLYGPDSGLAAERRAIITQIILGTEYDQLQLVKFAGEQLSKEPEQLYNEINAFSLIPGRKLIIISDAAKLGKIMVEALEQHKSDCFILAIAGELPPSNALRKNFESTTEAASLPCYQDSLEASFGLIRRELADITSAQEIISYIAHNVSGDRMILRNELAKLKLYAAAGNELTSAAVENLLALNNSPDFQDLANALAGYQANLAVKLAEELMASGIPPITLIRVIINYLQRILEVKHNMLNSNNFELAIKTLRPPVFFKQKDLLRGHVNNWPEKKLIIVLQKLENLELLAKSHASLPGDVLLKFFLLVASNR